MNNTEHGRNSQARSELGAYLVAAVWYRALGYSPIPIRPRTRKPPVSGYHGRDGKYPDAVLIEKWVRRFPNANVALRLPVDIIGIDVDAYEGKSGAETLATLERDLGQLPLTWISTARRDGVSGIRLYRIPGLIAPLAWRGSAGPGIDIIHSGNRYVIVPPSMHANGRRYRWNQTAGLCPPEDLPGLSNEWIDHLAEGAGAEMVHGNRGDRPGSGNRTDRSGSLNGLRKALREHGGGQPCPQLQQICDRAVSDIRSGASAHDSALGAVFAITRDFAKGHRGATSALWTVRAAFLSAPGPRQRARTAVAEFSGMFRGIATPSWAGTVSGPPSGPPSDPCEELQAGLSIGGLTPERIDRLKRARKERK